MDESAPAIYHVNGDDKEDKTLEIPTTLSAFGNFARDIADLPLKQIIWRFDNLLSKMEEDMPQLIETYQTAGKKLDAYFDKSVPEVNQSLNQFNQTLKDISNASKSIKNLSDYLERHPDSVIKGKKGE